MIHEHWYLQESAEPDWQHYHKDEAPSDGPVCIALQVLHNLDDLQPQHSPQQRNWPINYQYINLNVI